MTPTKELIGRRVLVLAWHDHAPILAAYRESARAEGEVTSVKHTPQGVRVVVRFARVVGEFPFWLSDLEVLPQRTFEFAGEDRQRESACRPQWLE